MLPETGTATEAEAAAAAKTEAEAEAEHRCHLLHWQQESGDRSTSGVVNVCRQLFGIVF